MGGAPDAATPRAAGSGVVRAAPTGNSWRCGTAPGAADTSGERRVVRDGRATAGLLAGPGTDRVAADRCTGAAVDGEADPSPSASVPASASPVPRTGRWSEGRSRSPGRPATGVRTPCSRPPGAEARTACPNSPPKDGF
ncbi:hypothetical protein [Streptomyces venezuelae]|uniref:hypothetical protein n=1 Tax=Streptomyces venezuelae TaxID=54571 RepID=UPI0037B85C7E